MTNRHILQVSELTKKVRFILESELNTVWLCGEISNFIAASSGHWYLSLKDSQAQVRCAMFKNTNRRVRIKPANGQQVLVRAKVSLYEPRGDFQLIIEQMEDAGEGLLRQKYEQLKTKLAAEGIFSQAIKKPLPKHISKIGIVTSPTGAAIKDILTVLNRRNPNVEIIIYPALVQGEFASNDISQAISVANQRAECQVLIVGRGGGSLEDLWSFNEEQVVRAIYQSTIPVISAVGHEIDTTLSDYAADIRAATPSAGAEIVSQDNQVYQDKIMQLIDRLNKSISQKVNVLQYQLKQRHQQLSFLDPINKMRLQQQKVDELSIRLEKAVNAKLQQMQLKPQQLEAKLKQLSPYHTVNKNQQLAQQLHQRLLLAINKSLENKKEQFAHSVGALNIVSPLATLARGYSVTKSEQGQIISSIKQVVKGNDIKVQVSDGFIEARVSNKVAS